MPVVEGRRKLVADANPIPASGRHRYVESRPYSAPNRKLKPAE